jgi:hypothetical protein
MAFIYLPRINPPDYDAVRTILDSSLPDTHEVWLKLQIQAELDFQTAGHSCRHIRIDPDEFSRYCAGHSYDRNLDGLNNFVNKKVGGASY